MSSWLVTVKGIVNDLQDFKTKKVPNFETNDDTYATDSYLAEFEDGKWGPLNQTNTQLHEFA